MYYAGIAEPIRGKLHPYLDDTGDSSVEFIDALSKRRVPVGKADLHIAQIFLRQKSLRSVCEASNIIYHHLHVDKAMFRTEHGQHCTPCSSSVTSLGRGGFSTKPEQYIYRYPGDLTICARKVRDSRSDDKISSAGSSVC